MTTLFYWKIFNSLLFIHLYIISFPSSFPLSFTIFSSYVSTSFFSTHSAVPSRSVVSDFLWSHGLCQATLSMGILHTRILEWVAMPSSTGSSQPRDQTQVSHITGGFFTSWATREAQPILTICGSYVLQSWHKQWISELWTITPRRNTVGSVYGHNTLANRAIMKLCFMCFYLKTS